MRRFFNFGKSVYQAYQAPQVAPVPEGQTAGQNGTMINESKRQIQVVLFDGGKPEDLLLALGTLEVAKDIVKQTISLWHEKDRRNKGIIKVQGNGGGHG